MKQKIFFGPVAYFFLALLSSTILSNLSIADTPSQSTQNASLAELAKEDAAARAAYQKKHGARLHRLKTSEKASSFAEILQACPAGAQTCIEEEVSIAPKDDVPLGAELIPAQSYVTIGSGLKKMKVKLQPLEGEPSCNGTYLYGKMAWTGADTILTSKGPASAAKVFAGFRIYRDYKEAGYDSRIKTVSGNKKLLERPGAELNPEIYFIKEGLIAKKMQGKCIQIGTNYSKADWCNKEHSFGNERKSSKEPSDGTSERAYRTPDGKYELVIVYSPAC